MKSLTIFIKTQLKFLTILFFLTVIPYLILCLYLPKIPYMHYFFIIIIFLIKLLAINESELQKSLKEVVVADLVSELKKNPSRDHIFKRIQFIAIGRNICLMIAATTIIITAIIFQRL